MRKFFMNHSKSTFFVDKWVSHSDFIEKQTFLFFHKFLILMFLYNIIIKKFLKKALIIKGVNTWIRFIKYILVFRNPTFTNSFPQFIHILVVLIYSVLRTIKHSVSKLFS